MGRYWSCSANRKREILGRRAINQRKTQQHRVQEFVFIYVQTEFFMHCIYSKQVFLRGNYAVFLFFEFLARRRCRICKAEERSPFSKNSLCRAHFMSAVRLPSGVYN